MKSISGGEALQRLAIGERAAFEYRLRSERHVAAARFRQRSHVCGCIGGGLLGHRFVHLLARSGHGMGRADVRARRHDGDVGGHRDARSRPRPRGHRMARRTRRRALGT